MIADVAALFLTGLVSPPYINDGSELFRKDATSMLKPGLSF